MNLADIENEPYSQDKEWTTDSGDKTYTEDDRGNWHEVDNTVYTDILDKVEKYLEEGKQHDLLYVPEKLHDYTIIATWHISPNLVAIVGSWTGPINRTEYVVSYVTPTSLEYGEWLQGYYTYDVVHAMAKFSELAIEGDNTTM